MRDESDFYQEILMAKANPRVGYGGNVLPSMEIYAAIKTYEERKAYQGALEKLLRSVNEDDRKFGIDLCLGFFMFRDALRDHKDG